MTQKRTKDKMPNSDIQNTRQKKGVNDLKRYANRVGHRDTHFVH
jgi:hypothetical protein